MKQFRIITVLLLCLAAFTPAQAGFLGKSMLFTGLLVGGGAAVAAVKKNCQLIKNEETGKSAIKCVKPTPASVTTPDATPVHQ